MTQFWWITTNPVRWHWKTIYENEDGEQFFPKQKILQNFDSVRAGDFIFGYLSSPYREIVALAWVKKGLHVCDGDEGILIKHIGNSLLRNPVSWDILRHKLINSEPVKCNAQGTLFRLTADEARIIAQLLKQEGNDIALPNHLKHIEEILFEGLDDIESELPIPAKIDERKNVSEGTENYPKGSEGYLYILVNASLQENYHKIGMTTKTPDIRARELSRASGLPSEYKVAYAVKVSDCRLAENLVHKKLSGFRITNTRPDRDREFFNIPLAAAISVVGEVAKQIGV